MRAPLSSLFAALALAGCVSGTRTIVVREYPAATPAPVPAVTPAPVPLPTPRRLTQLEVAVGNPSSGRLPVQTNRAAYVAIFEIVPKQGVTLLHPSTAKQGRTVVSGLRYIPVEATSPAPTRPASNSARAQRPARYIYALASDTPIRIPDRAMEPGYLEQLLGPSSYRSASPQASVRALSRHFAPKVSDEQWAEDLYAVEPSGDARPPRMARIYCNRRVHEVPEDIADRAWCPERNASPGVLPTPARPDSVVGGNGRRIGPRAPEKAGRIANLPDRRPEHPAHPAHPAHPVKPDHPSTPRNERAEKEKAEKAENERAEKEKAEKAEKERAEKEKAEKAEKERVEKEKAEKAEKGRVEKEKAEKDKADKARGQEESGGAADSDTSAAKPDEDGAGRKGSSPARDAGERKTPEKSKNVPKADSTRNVSSRGTPSRGRTDP